FAAPRKVPQVQNENLPHVPGGGTAHGDSLLRVLPRVWTHARSSKVGRVLGADDRSRVYRSARTRPAGRGQLHGIRNRAGDQLFHAAYGRNRALARQPYFRVSPS